MTETRHSCTNQQGWDGMTSPPHPPTLGMTQGALRAPPAGGQAAGQCSPNRQPHTFSTWSCCSGVNCAMSSARPAIIVPRYRSAAHGSVCHRPSQQRRMPGHAGATLPIEHTALPGEDSYSAYHTVAIWNVIQQPCLSMACCSDTNPRGGVSSSRLALVPFRISWIVLEPRPRKAWCILLPTTSRETITSHHCGIANTCMPECH